MVLTIAGLHPPNLSLVRLEQIQFHCRDSNNPILGDQPRPMGQQGHILGINFVIYSLQLFCSRAHVHHLPIKELGNQQAGHQGDQAGDGKESTDIA
jgi:hypothetical protein